MQQTNSLKNTRDNPTLENVNFDTNQDSPGNFHWEALYKALPAGTKVILTVRDNDEQWYKSWLNYLTRG